MQPIPYHVPPRRNSLGTAGAIVSILGAVCCIGAVLMLFAIEMPEDRPLTNKDPLQESVDTAITGAVVVTSQALIFVIGWLVGGTMCLVGFGLSVAGVMRRPPHLAIVGLIASLLGPLALLAHLLIRWNMVQP